MTKNETQIFWGGALILLIAVLLGIEATLPEQSLNLEADPQLFSGERALQYARELFKEEVPHYCGSPANRIVRDRIVRKFQDWGIQVKTEMTFGHIFFNRFAYAENIIATLPGSEGEESILLVAHYDSVRASMNSKCDGSGVALLLELARTLKQHPRTRRSIIFFFADSEEVGLQGSNGFIKDNPELVNKISAVISIDNMKPNRITTLMARGKSSSFIEKAYLNIPGKSFYSSVTPSYTMSMDPKNFGDYGSFSDAGIDGIHFGGARGPEYHTPLENLSILEPNHLQNLGTKSVRAVQHLANAERLDKTNSELVYFSLFGRLNIYWTADLNLLLVFISTLLFLLGMIIQLKRKSLHWKQTFYGAIITLFILGTAAVFSMLMNSLFNTSQNQNESYPATGILYMIIIWLTPFLWMAVSHRVFRKRTHFYGMVTGMVSISIVVAVLFSLLFKGSSYLILVPLLLVSTAILIATVLKRENSLVAKTLIGLVPLFFTAHLFSSLLISIFESAGMEDLLFPGILASFVPIFMSPLMMLIPARTLTKSLYAVLAVLFLSIIGLMILPPFTASHPIQMNFFYFQDCDSRQAYYLAPSLNGETEKLIGNRFGTTLKKIDTVYETWFASNYFTRSNYPGWQVKGEWHQAPPPVLTILEQIETEKGRTVRMALKSGRHANMLGLLFPPHTKRKRIKVKKHEGIYNGKGAEAWREYEFYAVPPEGIILELELDQKIPVEAVIFDCDFFLPRSSTADKLKELRPEWATIKHRGDRWYRFKSVQF